MLVIIIVHNSNSENSSLLQANPLYPYENPKQLKVNSNQQFCFKLEPAHPQPMNDHRQNHNALCEPQATVVSMTTPHHLSPSSLNTTRTHSTIFMHFSPMMWWWVKEDKSKLVIVSWNLKR